MLMAILLTILISFFATTLFGHSVHWALHQSWTGRVNDAHMTHHLRLYPPDDFTSKVYRDAKKDSTPKFFAVCAVPLILAPIVLWSLGYLPLVLMITALVVEGLMGFLHNYLHDAFHIQDHWLSRVPVIKIWFKHLVDLHWLHHIDMSKNYLIFFSFWDRVFGTFWNK